MRTKKKLPANLPGVEFDEAVLRVVLSSGGTFDDEAKRLAALHYAILAMHPNDVDYAGGGPGRIIADLDKFRDAKRFANLFAAAPALLTALRDVKEALDDFYQVEPRHAGQHFGAALHERMQLALAKAKGNA